LRYVGMEDSSPSTPSLNFDRQAIGSSRSPLDFELHLQ